MRIKSVHLKNYKRFTDLSIKDIPESARLVVVVGPNGTGKSSLFDAFLLKAQSFIRNYGLDGARREYYMKNEHVNEARFSATQEISDAMNIEFYSGNPAPDRWNTIFNIRSAYRNEAHFQLENLQRMPPSSESVRLERIIDLDQAVSDNYRRLLWKRQADLDDPTLGDMTFDKYRKESLQELQTSMRELFQNPVLVLQDFGGITSSGVFRFSKGSAIDFHYMNLSGGEKAAFDLPLDIFVKRHEYQDAIYCIDEPEDHIAAVLHGDLLRIMLDLVPEESQLWVATHSIGIARKAFDMMRQNDDVAFLDFSNRDFDKPVVITPQIPNRAFWQSTHRVALDDLADLIAPGNIVLCEGNEAKADKGFDAECYNRIFSDEYPDTLFISHGGSNQVEKSDALIAILGAVAKGVNVRRLIDRDDMTDTARNESISENIAVLRRREIENYLYDPEVIEEFLNEYGKEDCVDTILAKRECLIDANPKGNDVKSVSRDLFDFIKKTTHIPNLGRRREEFAKEFLVPALKKTHSVYKELRADVFP